MIDCALRRHAFYTLWCVAVFLCALRSSLVMAKEMSWFAYGDLRGHIESCGCDPKTDLGGLGRLSVFLQRERSQISDAVVFDLGNNLSSKEKDAVKNRYLSDGLAQLKPDFSLMNEVEYSLGEPFIGSRAYTLSNLKKKHASIEPLRVSRDKRLVVLGYLWTKKLSDQLVKVDQTLIAKWRSWLSSHQLDKVLLFSGPQKQLVFIQKQELFDLIISSNTSPFGKEQVMEEREDPFRLERTQKVLMVPVWGGGVLRGGGAKKKVAKSIQELLSPKRSQKEMLALQDPVSLLKENVPVSWLDYTYDDGESPLKHILTQYVDASKGLFKFRQEEKKPFLKTSRFAGSNKCQICHQQAYEAWSESRHAHAYETLKHKNRHQDSFCISCHVVGWKEKDGFVGKKETVHLKGVQCENCHGPRKAHMTNPSIKGEKAKVDACVTCHQKDHSPQFEKTHYWSQIKHSLEREMNKW